jgi:rhodanese-related sulfurtransferase
VPALPLARAARAGLHRQLRGGGRAGRRCPRVFGALQANEALKQILGLPGAISGEVLYLDLLQFSTRRIRAQQRAGCPACAQRGKGTENGAPYAFAQQEEEDLELALDALPTALSAFEVIDMRAPAEALAAPLPWPARLLPGDTLGSGPGPFTPEGRYLIVCTRGLRSRYLVMHLRALGISGAFSLRGGAAALART